MSRHTKRTRAQRRADALERQEHYAALSFDQKLARASEGSRQWERLLGIRRGEVQRERDRIVGIAQRYTDPVGAFEEAS